MRVGNEKEVLKQILPPYKGGETVVIINNEHVWAGEFALICDTKHKFVRLELLGTKIWMPTEWVEHHDSNQLNE